MATTRILKIDSKDAQKQIDDLSKKVQQLDGNLDNIGKVSVDGIDDLGKAIDNVTNGVGNLNKDLRTTTLTIDQLAPNIAKMGAGLSGGFAIVTGAMSVMGSESEEAKKAISSLQFYLQQLPIQFFAIAEGITAMSNVLAPFKNKFANIFGNVFGEIDSLELFKDVLEEVKKRLELELNDIKEEIPKNEAIVKNLREYLDQFALKNFETTDVLFYTHQTLYELGEDGLEKLKEVFTYLYEDREVPPALTVINDAFNNAISSFKNLSKELQKEAIDIIQYIPEIDRANEKLFSALDKQKLLEEKKEKVKQTIKQIDDKLISVGYRVGKFFKAIFSPQALGIYAAIAAVTLFITAVTKSLKKAKELNQLSKDMWSWTRSMSDITATGKKNAAEQAVIVQTLLRNANDENNSLKNRVNAIKQLNEIVPGYNGHLKESASLTEKNKKACEDYVAELKRQAVAEAAVSKITEKYKEIIEKTIELEDAKVIAEQVEAAEKLREESFNKQLAQRGIFNDQIVTEDRETYDKIKGILTDHNLEVAASVPVLEKEIQQAMDDIEYIYENFDTNILKKFEQGVGKVEAVNTEMIRDFNSELLTVSESIDELMNPASSSSKLPYWYKVMQDVPKQLEILNDTMQRFGESTMGLTGGYANVVSDFGNMFSKMTEIITKTMETGTTGTKQWIDMVSSGVQAVGTLLNALGDEQDTATRQGFETQKKYQISATVMNMLAGIMSAWSSAMILTPPANVIMGAANAAMIGSLGAVQIAKIANQKFGGTSSAAVNSTIIPPVNYSSLVQGASTEASIKNTRSYVSVVEINKKQKSVSVSEEEAKY